MAAPLFSYNNLFYEVTKYFLYDGYQKKENAMRCHKLLSSMCLQRRNTTMLYPSHMLPSFPVFLCVLISLEEACNYLFLSKLPAFTTVLGWGSLSHHCRNSKGTGGPQDGNETNVMAGTVKCNTLWPHLAKLPLPTCSHGSSTKKNDLGPW